MCFGEDSHCLFYGALVLRAGWARGEVLVQPRDYRGGSVISGVAVRGLRCHSVGDSFGNGDSGTVD